MPGITWNVNIRLGQIDSLDSKLDKLAENFGEKIRRAASYGMQALNLIVNMASRVVKTTEGIQKLQKFQLGVSVAGVQLSVANLMIEAQARMATNPVLGWWMMTQAMFMEINAVQMIALQKQQETADRSAEEYSSEMERISWSLE